MRIVRNIKLALVSLVMAAGMAYSFALPVAAAGAAGQAKADVCAGITAGGGTCDDSGAGITSIIRLVIQIFSVVAGIAAVIMIITGGLRYITSGGDSSKVSGAKNTILYAIIGLVIVALAQIIVRFVLDTATKP
jgi:hypothetical protein